MTKTLDNLNYQSELAEAIRYGEREVVSTPHGTCVFYEYNGIYYLTDYYSPTSGGCEESSIKRTEHAPIHEPEPGTALSCGLAQQG